MKRKLLATKSSSLPLSPTPVWSPPMLKSSRSHLSTLSKDYCEEDRRVMLSVERQHIAPIKITPFRQQRHPQPLHSFISPFCDDIPSFHLLQPLCIHDECQYNGIEILLCVVPFFTIVKWRWLLIQHIWLFDDLVSSAFWYIGMNVATLLRRIRPSRWRSQYRLFLGLRCFCSCW